MSNAVIPFKCKRCATEWQRTLDELNRPGLEGYRDLTPDAADAQLGQYGDDCPNCGARTIVEVKIRSGGRHG